MRTAIVGGGAAGFFLAINLKEMCPQMDVTIFEKSKKVLAKVEVSGGGRCNCTNTLESKNLPSVFFAGEVLDIDGVTGGFNFQAAWTTAYTVACAISQQARCSQSPSEV